MGDREALLLDLVEHAYAATIEAEGWAPALRRLGKALRGSSVVMGTVWRPRGVTDLCLADAPDAVRETMFDRFDTTEANPAFRHAGRVKVGALLPMPLFETEAEFLRSPVCNDLLRPHGLRWGVGAILQHTPEFTTAINIARAPDAGRYDADELAFLSRLLPHFARAEQVRRELQSARDDHRCLAETIGAVDCAVLVVDRHARVGFANGAAERLLAANDGLLTLGGRLAAARTEDTRRLRGMIAGAAATAAGRALSAGGALSVPRPSLRSPYAVLVAPLPARADSQDCPRRPAAAVFVNDPERQRDPPRQWLEELYGLTPAEATLALALLGGCGLREAADTLGVSENTAKTHLKSVFAKTDVRRQAELVRRILHDFGTLDPARLAHHPLG